MQIINIWKLINLLFIYLFIINNAKKIYSFFLIIFFYVEFLGFAFPLLSVWNSTSGPSPFSGVFSSASHIFVVGVVWMWMSSDWGWGGSLLWNRIQSYSWMNSICNQCGFQIKYWKLFLQTGLRTAYSKSLV